jgi:hypothetical protein
VSQIPPLPDLQRPLAACGLRRQAREGKACGEEHGSMATCKNLGGCDPAPGASGLPPGLSEQATGTPCPWLQPGINDAVQQIHAEGYRDGIIVSIGFLCDHVELLDALDIQARDMAMACGMTAQRAATVGTRSGLLSRLRT